MLVMFTSLPLVPNAGAQVALNMAKLEPSTANVERTCFTRRSAAEAIDRQTFMAECQRYSSRGKEPKTLAFRKKPKS